MGIQCKDSHVPALSAKQKGAMAFGIDGHSMVELAALDGILSHDAICCGINLSNLVCAPQIDVNLPRDRIVLRHTGFTVKPESLDDVVLINVNDGQSFSERIGDVD